LTSGVEIAVWPFSVTATL